MLIAHLLQELPIQELELLSLQMHAQYSTSAGQSININVGPDT